MMKFDISRMLRMLWFFVFVASFSLIFIYKYFNFNIDATFYKLLITFITGYIPFTLCYKFIPQHLQQEILVINACIVTLIVSIIIPFANHFFLFFIPVLSLLVQCRTCFYILNTVVLFFFVTFESHNFVTVIIEFSVFICFIILVRYVGEIIFTSIQRNFHFKKMIDALIFAIETKDRYTRGHSLRVAEYAIILGEYYIFLGGKVDLEKLKISALLHDVGKVYIPDNILTKNGPLTISEYSTIKHHPKYGADIIKGFDYSEDIISDILHHHERYDGKGYPDGLVGEDIPINSRILAIVDTFDALTSNRSYRNAFSKEEAKKIILDNFGTQFDPNLRRSFEFAYPVLAENKSSYDLKTFVEEII
ncbi:MAG: hypothetical protein K0S51_2126 [Bacillales bacterium]|nr:hypothetical protein [Bacillales bacterium]